MRIRHFIRATNSMALPGKPGLSLPVRRTRSAQRPVRRYSIVRPFSARTGPWPAKRWRTPRWSVFHEKALETIRIEFAYPLQDFGELSTDINGFAAIGVDGSRPIEHGSTPNAKPMVSATRYHALESQCISRNATGSISQLPVSRRLVL